MKAFKQIRRSSAQVGDYVTFTCTTRGSGRKKVRRQIVGFEKERGWIGVRYDGWSIFYVGAFRGDRIHRFEREVMS